MTPMQEVDLVGLKCPMPIVQLSKFIKELDADDEVTVIADDPAFCLDVKSWCRKTGHKLVRLDNVSERIVAMIRKKDPESE